MKQTNSAITMLLGSFRSIFKRAYVKGIASAVVLTAGLSAGAANAADVAFDEAYSSGDNTAIEISDTSGSVSLSGTKWANSGISMTEGSALTVGGNGTLAVAGDFKLNNADLNVTGGDTTTQIVGTTDIGMENGNHIADAAFTAVGSDITLGQSGSISFASVSISGGTVKLTGEEANIYAYGTGYNFVTGNTDNSGNQTLNDADMLIDGTAITSDAKNVKNLALGAFDVMTIRNSSIQIGGDSDVVSGSDTRLTIVGAGYGDAGDAASIQISDTSIAVNGESTLYLSAKQGSGDIALNNVDITGHKANILVKGDAHVSGKLNITGEGTDDTVNFVGVTPGNDLQVVNDQTYTSDLIGESADINLNGGQIGFADIELNSGSLTVKGGTKTSGVWAYGEGSNRQTGAGGKASLFAIDGTDVNLLGKAAVGSYAGDFEIIGADVDVEGTGNSLQAAGDLILSGTAIDVAEDAALTLNGTNITADGGTISNSGTLNIKGRADLSELESFTSTGTINVTGSTSNGNSNSYGLTVDTVSNLVDGSGSITLTASDTDDYVHLTVEGEDKFDLTADDDFTLTGSGHFALNAENSTVTVGADSSGFYRLGVGSFIGKTNDGTYTIASGDEVYVISSVNLISDDSSDELEDKTLNVSGSLTLGTNEDYASSDPTVADTGTFNGVNLVLNHDNAEVNFDHGTWTGVGDVTVTAGDFSVNNGAEVTVDKLSASAANDVTVEGSTLIAGDLALKDAAAGTVSVSTKGIFQTGISNVINFTDGTDGADGSALAESSKYSGSVIELDGTSILKLTGASAELKGNTITVGEFQSIKEAILGTDGMGTISFDDVTIALDPDVAESKKIDASDAADYAGSDALAGITVTDATTVDNGTNTWGDAELAAGTISLGVSSGAAVNLNKANSNGAFVTDSDGYVAGVTLTSNGSAVSLNNGGEVGNISGDASATNQAVVVDGNNAATTIGAVTNVNNVTLSNGAVNVGAVSGVENLTVANSDVTAQDDMSVTNLNLDSALESAVATEATGNDPAVLYDVTAETLTMSESASLVTNTLTLGGSSSSTTSVLSGKVQAQTISVSNQTGNTVAIVNGTVAADSLTLTGTSGTVTVGQAGTDDEGATGSLQLTSLDLGGGMLLLDPEYGQRAAFTSVIGEDEEDFVNVSGSVGVGQNSVFVAGTTEAEAQAILAKLGLLNGSGSLDRNNVGAAVVINKTYEIASGAALYLDVDGVNGDGENSLAQSITDLNLGGSGGAVVLGENTALVVTDAFVNNENATYIIEFEDTTNTTDNVVNLADGSKIIFDSTALLAGDQVSFANTADTQVTDSGVEISAAGGLLSGEIVSGSATNSTEIAFTFNEDGIGLLTNQSNPIKAMTVNVLRNEGGDSYDTTDAGTAFISQIGAIDGGKAIETAARLATYAGAIQATYMAQQASTEAVADRLGMANPNSALISSDNRQGGGLWLMPVYKNHDSDSFDAQGVDYGADIDLAGVALGADVTTDSGVRVGAYFNVGSGDADGQGVADQVSNDFDYYGMGIYAGAAFGQFALIADAGFTQVSNDIDQNVNTAGYGTLTADTDTQAVTVGLRGEYKFVTSYVDVTPHLGLRYTNLDMDSYDVKSDGGVIASTDADSMAVFSIPVGVTFSKDIIAGDWSVKPVFDLTLTANTGDDELDTDTTFVGVETVGLSTEVIDDFTYGGTLGIDAQYKDSLSFGVNVSYVGSDNADEFGVVGNIRYSF